MKVHLLFNVCTALIYHYFALAFWPLKEIVKRLTQLKCAFNLHLFLHQKSGKLAYGAFLCFCTGSSKIALSEIKTLI